MVPRGLSVMLPAVFAGIAIATIGCAERTTRQDVADARAKYEKERQETAQTVHEAQDDVRQAHTANKPVVDRADAEVADAQRKANEQISSQKHEERKAAAELQATEDRARAVAALLAALTFNTFGEMNGLYRSWRASARREEALNAVSCWVLVVPVPSFL